MNTTPQGNRLHIAFFGKTNVGKSSLINALTGQSIALVSSVSGTTTDPVYKAMELLPLGPVMLIDTAGIGDHSQLGPIRLQKTREVLHKTDLAILVLDSTQSQLDTYERDLLDSFKEFSISSIIAFNKSDISQEISSTLLEEIKHSKLPYVHVSATTGYGLDAIKEQIIRMSPQDQDKFRIVGDLVNPGDFVVLVVPIDKAAPKGRLILPQQQTIRDLLESDAMAIVTKDQELRETLENIGKKPSLVITDSQAFLKVAADTPKNIPLTSFSILFARYKGDLNTLVKGATIISQLKDGDKILIAEACTHHRQSDDIGTVKIPRWLRQISGKNLIFDHCAGIEFKENLSDYKLIVHCGACMLNRKAMKYRLSLSEEQGIPIVNYGILIAYVHGILDRALEPFPMAKLLWDQSQNSICPNT